jgi:uncharacterized protein involved in exopolysaccharide biosynthesis
MAEQLSDGVAVSRSNYAELDLRPLREHRVFIIIFVFSAMLCALALTYIYSERYRSEVTFLFKPSQVTELVKHSKEAFGTSAPGSMVVNITHTLDDLVHSDGVLRQIVAKLHLAADSPKDVSAEDGSLNRAKAALQDFAKGAISVVMFGRVINDDPINRAVAGLRKQIKLTNDDSYVYTLQVTADSPQHASGIADEAAAALIQFLRDDAQHSVGKPAEELVSLRDGKRRDVERIEAQMRELLSQNEITSIKDELEKATDTVSALRRARADTQADLRQSEGKVAALAEKLRVPSMSKLAEDGGPAAAPARTSRINADDYAKLTSDRLTAEVNSASLHARLNSLERSSASFIPRLRVLNQVQAEYDVLSAELNSAKRDYSALSDAVQEFAIRAADNQTELRLQAKAITPVLPVSPVKIYHVVFATVLAAMIAVGLAYMLDYFHIRLFLPSAGGGPRRRRREAELAPEPAVARVASK